MSGGRMVFPGAVPIRGDAGYQGPKGDTGPTGPQGPPGTPAVVMSVTATAPVVVSGTLADPVVSIPAATAAIPGYMTAVQAAKLDGIAAGATVAPVTAVAGRTGAVVLVKADVGLGNVDNTSDVNKPVSTAQAAADTAATNAAKAYADGLIVGLWDDRGSFNASVNTYPAAGGSGTAGAILKGDIWTISVAGTLGGVAVNIGDSVRAVIDTPAQVAANWAILENNIGYVPENVASRGVSYPAGSGTSTGTNTGDQTPASLGLVIGTNVQAYDADLTTWAGITPGGGVASVLAVGVGTAGSVLVRGSSAVVSTLDATSIAIGGTAGAGFVTFVGQSSNPAAPAAGSALIHAATTSGFTRFEQDNEALTNIVLGRDSVTIVKNTTAAIIAKGSLIYVTGSTGNVPNVALAQANSFTTLPAAYIVMDAIAVNAFGQVMRSGVISGVNTSAFAAGDRVYVSTTVAGGLTNVRPSGAVNAVQRIGTVLVSGVGNGSIDVGIAPALLNMETGTNAATWTAQAVVAVSFSGAHNGTLGATTPAAASVTTLTASGNSILGGGSTYSATQDRLTVRIAQNDVARLVIDNQNAGAAAYSRLGIYTSGNSWDISTGSTAANSNALNFISGAATAATLTTGGNLTIPGSLTSGAASVTTLTASGIAAFGGTATIADATMPVQLSTGGAGTEKWIGVNKNGASSYGLMVGYANGSTLGTGAVIRQATADPIYIYVNNTVLAATITSAGAVTIPGSLSTGAATTAAIAASGGLRFTATSAISTPGIVLNGINALNIRSGTGGFSVNNNADTVANLTIADAGAVTIPGSLLIGVSAGGETGQLSIYPVAGTDALQINVPASLAMAFDTSQIVTGTTPGGSRAVLNRILIVSDNAHTAAEFGNALLIQHNAGGAAMRGHREALDAQFNLNVIPGTAGAGNFTVDPNYVGAALVAFASVHSQGTSATVFANSNGSVFGSNPVAHLYAGATGYKGVFGEEVNIGIATGASAYMKAGIVIASRPDDMIRGTGANTGSGSSDTTTIIDAALAVSNQGSTTKWTNGILFHSTNGYFPFDGGSTVLKTAGGTFAHGIDFGNSTIAAGGTAFRSPGFAVDKDGYVYTRNATAASGKSAALLFSATAALGLYFGTGDPSATLSAAQGSLYLRVDSSSATTRAYINNNGGTGWSAVQCV